MKKILSVLVLTLMVLAGCSSKKATAASAEKKGGDITFEYSAITRGSFRKVNATQNGVTLATDPKAKPERFEISTAEWNTLVDFYENNIGEKHIALNSLEAPSKKHQFDGAMAATLTVKKDGEEFTSQTFDHGNPPAEIKGLVDEILKLAGLEAGK